MKNDFLLAIGQLAAEKNLSQNIIFEAVEAALASIKHEKSRKTHLQKSVDSAKETNSLILGNYTEGLVDFQNVLDAERTVFDREDTAAASAGQLAINASWT